MPLLFAWQPHGDKSVSPTMTLSGAELAHKTTVCFSHDQVLTD